MNSNPHLTPVQVAERLIGPPPVLSRAAGVAEKASYGWRRASASRDAGDIPEGRQMRRLLAHAAARGIPLKPEHLIWGAPAAEIEALLEQMRRASSEVTAAE